MDIDREDLEWAAGKDLVSEEQAERLWTALQERQRASPSGSPQSSFDVASVAYYGGALIVVVAMCWFMLRVSEEFGYVSLFATALAYGGAFAGMGALLRYRRSLPVAGGLLIVLAVTMTPVALYSLERGTLLWPAVYALGQWIGLLPDPTTYEIASPELYERLQGDWLLEEIGTVIAGLVALRYVRFPFLTAPIAVALWAMATVSAPDLLVGDGAWNTRLWVSVAFGSTIMIGAYLVDRRTEDDYAFWGYLFGLMAFWGALSLMDAGTEWEYFLYCCTNVLLVLLGIFLERRAFLVFGALGVFQYLNHLSYAVFSDSVFFPIALSIIGLGFIYLGVTYQQNRRAIDLFFWSHVPPALRRLSPRQR